MIPSKAFILAAGLGTRMRPITDKIPKPLVEVNGRTLLERTIDQLEDVGVREIVINTHHLAEQIPARLKHRTSPHIHFSYEKELLDTGGGVKKAIHHFGNDPFFVLSGDGLWTGDGLKDLTEAWDPVRMDVLLLLQPLSTFDLTEGVGDYDMLPDGHIRRSKDKKGAYMFTSIRINAAHIYKGTPDGAFSYLQIMDEAEKAGRLYGLAHKGEWHHISTPQDLESVNKVFKS
jgi:MurNAc alpha-1-phosphate uridylyltransferase